LTLLGLKQNLGKSFNFIVIAVLLLSISVGMASLNRKAYATAGILDTRSVKMSSSVNAANNVKYSFAFSIGTTGNIGGIVIDFCTEDPIVADTCTLPTSFDTNKSTIGNPASQVGVTGMTTDTTNSTSKTLILTRTASSISSGTAVTFDMGNGTSTGIKNPATTNTTFYARILTYAATATAQAYASTVPGTYVDFGGIALSTTAQLVVTAKVQEQLTFCIYTGANCGAGGTAVTLGDANGILSTSASYTNITGKFNASTNGTNGMDIYAAGATLTSPQSNTISAIGSSAAASSTGSEQYGFCIAVSGGSVTAISPYNHASCSSVTTGANAAGAAQFAFDLSSGTNLGTLGGMKVASASGPTLTTTGTIAFLANIAATTKAGVYTSTMTWVAVGKF
jgi:hypothetical protein